MITQYVWVKFFHILIAILALGTSAGLGIVLEFLRQSPYARTISTPRHLADCCLHGSPWIRAHARIGSVDGKSLLANDDKVDPSSSPWRVGRRDCPVVNLPRGSS